MTSLTILDFHTSRRKSYGLWIIRPVYPVVLSPNHGKIITTILTFGSNKIRRIWSKPSWLITCYFMLFHDISWYFMIIHDHLSPWSELIRIDKNWSELIRIDQDWSELIRIDKCFNLSHTYIHITNSLLIVSNLTNVSTCPIHTYIHITK